jgi:hypothetical protein
MSDDDLDDERHILGSMIDYSSKQDLGDMHEISHVPKNFQCPDCYSSWPSKMSLVAHRRNHSTKNKGEDGDACTTSPTGLTLHVCKGCKKKYKYHKSYIDHQTKCKKYSSWKKDEDIKHKKLLDISNGLSPSASSASSVSNSALLPPGKGLLSFGSMPETPIKITPLHRRPTPLVIPLGPTGSNTPSPDPTSQPNTPGPPSEPVTPSPEPNTSESITPSPDTNTPGSPDPNLVPNSPPSENINVDLDNDYDDIDQNDDLTTQIKAKRIQSQTPPDLSTITIPPDLSSILLQQRPPNTIQTHTPPVTIPPDLSSIIRPRQLPLQRPPDTIQTRQRSLPQLPLSPLPLDKPVKREKVKKKVKLDFDNVFDSETKLPNLIYYCNDDEAPSYPGSMDAKLDWYLKMHNLK